jgi:YHS domain-containing protein
MGTPMNNYMEKSGYSQSDIMSLRDPVCGMKVNSVAALSLNYRGNTYYFDSEECLTVFQKNPEQFASMDMKMNNRNGRNRMSAAAVMGGTAMVATMIVMIFTMSGEH